MKNRWDRCRNYGYRYKRGIIPYDDNEMVDSEKAFVVSGFSFFFSVCDNYYARYRFQIIATIKLVEIFANNFQFLAS